MLTENYPKFIILKKIQMGTPLAKTTRSKETQLDPKVQHNKRHDEFLEGKYERHHIQKTTT